MSATRRFLGSPFIVAAAIIAACTAFAFRTASTPTSVAVIDLEVIYAQLEQHKAAEQQLNAMVDGLAVEIEKREQELEMVQLELKTVYTAQSPGYIQAQAAAQSAVGRLRAYQEFAKMKTERESERLLKETYDMVKATCKQIAGEQGIQLVLLDDATPAFAGNDPRPMMQQISARRSLFVDPSLDITALVVERMNRDFAAKTGAAPSAP